MLWIIFRRSLFLWAGDMHWTLIISVAAVAFLIVAIVLIKRKQDAPLKSFARTITATRSALKQKPQKIYFTPRNATQEERFDPKTQQPEIGDFRLILGSLTIHYKYERTIEFAEFSGDGLAKVGIQYIEGDAKEIFLDNDIIEDLRRYHEGYTSELMGVRRLIRKYVGLPKIEGEDE